MSDIEWSEAHAELHAVNASAGQNTASSSVNDANSEIEVIAEEKSATSQSRPASAVGESC